MRGGDDDVDIHPAVGVKTLRLTIDHRDNGITLFEPDPAGTARVMPNVPFSIEGTEDDETGRMSAIIEVVRD